MSNMMRALVKSRAEPGIWMEQVPLPDVGPNDVLVRVRKTAICGTDVHIYNWDQWAQKTVPVPMVTGHEFVGTVADFGAGVTEYGVGQRVSGEGHIVCGHCRNCRAGRGHLCRNTLGVGVNRPGAFADYVAIPKHNVVPIPGGNRFDVAIRDRAGAVRTITGVTLPMPGRHNVQNALAAIGVAAEMGIDDAVIARGFEHFGGVKRRFTKVGEVQGAVIIDDYGHHPVEIKAVLSAAREGAQGRVIALVQPHRFTRLNDLMEDFQGAFNDADVVLVAPVYAAGEQPIDGVDSHALVAGLKERGHRAARAVASLDEACEVLRDVAARGDMVICLGAGDITKWAAGLADGICQARLNK